MVMKVVFIEKGDASDDEMVMTKGKSGSSSTRTPV
jgi:hypothetical protein